MGKKQAGAEMTDSARARSAKESFPRLALTSFNGGLPCVFKSEGGAEIAVAAATDRLSVR